MSTAAGARGLAEPGFWARLARQAPIPLRLALRELRGGLMGLRLLAVCLFLGVAALAGVGSLSNAILEGLLARGQAILGGDVAIDLTHRPASAEERAAFEEAGVVSEIVQTRAMVGSIDGEERQISELKAVDGRYPLYGRFRLEGGGSLEDALANGGVVVERALADRLDLEPGDRVEVGAAQLRVGGIIAEEPDRASGGFNFGPSAFIARETLPETRLVQPGSLVQYIYRIRLPEGADPGAVVERLDARFPEAGWETRDRSNGAPGLRRFVTQLGQFLTLVGLTALIVAGVGVGNGVAGYLQAKTGTIATLKGLGASSRRINQSYLLQIGLVTAGAVAAGALVGAAVPWAVAQLAGDALPVPPVLRLYPGPLLTGMTYGALVAVAFALLPLARASVVPAARLRGNVERGGWPSKRVLVAVALAGVVLVALAVFQSDQELFAAGFIAGALVLFGLLTALANGVRWLARRSPRPRDPLARLALAGLHRPGSMTAQLIVALGLGLSLFATLSVIETSLSREIERTVPAGAPDLVFIDIPKEEIGAFRAMLERTAPGAVVDAVPSLRGPVTAVDGVPVTELGEPPEEAWILNGDRGLTYSAGPMGNNPIVAGRWWPADHQGPPLVSMDAEQARLLGLEVGDTISVSVLGVELTAEIANLREISWDRVQFNYVFIFSPDALAGAPHTWVAMVGMPEGLPERALTRAAAERFPTASIVRVGDVVGSVNDLLGQLSLAVRAAASVTIAAGIAVLVGALAAGRRARIYDAVLLKVLGATRRQVLSVYLMEYGALALIVALLALGVGAAAGWATLRYVLDLGFAPAWGTVAMTVFVGAAVTVLLGLAGSWSALSARPNQVLRTL